MKSLFTGLLLLAAGWPPVAAQVPLSLSLRQAQQVGLQNRFDVKANQFDVETAQTEITQRRQAWLPDVRATANVSYHPQIQATLIPAGFAGITEPIVLALGAKSISVFSLELRQPVYSPTLTTDVQLARSNAALEAERKRGRDIEVRQQISQAYLNSQLRGLQHRIATQEERRFREYYTLAEGRFKNGALIENDYLRARLDYENARQQTLISRQDYELSLRTLRYQLNVPATTPLALTDSLGAPTPPEAPHDDLAAVANRTEVKQLQLERERNGLQELRQRQAVQPVVSLVGNYSRQYLNADFNYNYTDGSWWSPFSAVGVQVALPLTGQLTNKTNLKLARFRTQQTEARQQQETARAGYEIEQATTQVDNARQNLTRTRSSYDLAQTVYRNQQQQLALGAFSHDTLLNTEASLLTAERNYVAASYDYLVARLAYEVATGTL